MRHITQLSLDLIKRFEGFSPVVYPCAAGRPTVDYGHLIRKGEHFDSMTEEEAEVLLRQDVAIAERAVLWLINVPLNERPV